MEFYDLTLPLLIYTEDIRQMTEKTYVLKKKKQFKHSSSIFYGADNMSISYSFCATCFAPDKIFICRAVILIYHLRLHSLP